MSEEILNEQNNEITYTQEDIDELKNENLRIHADFQNIKKRLIKEKENAIKYSNEKFALDLLEVLDTLYLAESHIKNDNEKEGIKITINKLVKVFEKYNITEVLYDIFDPNEHEAIQTIDNEQEKDKIIDIHRRGYKINDKILRPAMVTVSK